MEPNETIAIARFRGMISRVCDGTHHQSNDDSTASTKEYSQDDPSTGMRHRWPAEDQNRRSVYCYGNHVGLADSVGKVSTAYATDEGARVQHGEDISCEVSAHAVFNAVSGYTELWCLYAKNDHEKGATCGKS